MLQLGENKVTFSYFRGYNPVVLMITLFIMFTFSTGKSKIVMPLIFFLLKQEDWRMSLIGYCFII